MLWLLHNSTKWLEATQGGHTIFQTLAKNHTKFGYTNAWSIWNPFRGICGQIQLFDPIGLNNSLANLLTVRHM